MRILVAGHMGGGGGIFLVVYLQAIPIILPATACMITHYMWVMLAICM